MVVADRFIAFSRVYATHNVIHGQTVLGLTIPIHATVNHVVGCLIGGGVLVVEVIVEVGGSRVGLDVEMATLVRVGDLIHRP